MGRRRLNSDNENALMQSLRVSDSGASPLLSHPIFKGFGSEDEVLAAWQDGHLSTEQETFLKSALASNNSLRQQWLALSAAVPHSKHGALWHGLFRWHWATIGMTASVALVGVLLFRQGQLPMAPEDSMVMREVMVERSEADRVTMEQTRQQESLSEAKASQQLAAKRERAEMDERRRSADRAAEDLAEWDQAEIASAPRLQDQSPAPSRKAQPGPVVAAPPSMPSAARLAPEPVVTSPAWQDYLMAYQLPPDDAASDEFSTDRETRSDMALLGSAARAAEAAGCSDEALSRLRQAFQKAAESNPESLASLRPDTDEGWCGLGKVLEQHAQSAVRY